MLFLETLIMHLYTTSDQISLILILRQFGSVYLVIQIEKAKIMRKMNISSFINSN